MNVPLNQEVRHNHPNHKTAGIGRMVSLECSCAGPREIVGINPTLAWLWNQKQTPLDFIRNRRGYNHRDSRTWQKPTPIPQE
jgi:hypothetical protein